MRWTPRHIDAQRRTEILDAVDRDGAAGPEYLVLTLLSCAVATFGLVQNSGPAIIGAMLIVPAIGPVLAFSLALLGGDPERLTRALGTLLAGAALMLCFSALLGILIGWMGTIDLSAAGVATEVLSRTRPSLLDLGVALAAGAASAYTLVQPRLPTILPGALLALVLTPPICVMGIGLSQGEVTLWRGAALLLIGNFSAAVIACAVVFALAGLRRLPPARQPVRTPPRGAAAPTPRVGSLSAMVLVILLVVLAGSAIHAARETQPDALHAPPSAATSSALSTATPVAPRSALPAATSALTSTVTRTPSPVPPAMRPRRGMVALVRDTHGFGANARQSPALNGAVLAVLPEGSTIQLTGKKTIADGFGWLEVLLPNGKHAWIATNFLGPAPPTATASPHATVTPRATPRRRATATP